MTIQIYIGTAAEITDRLAGAPNATTTTVTAATQTIITVASATSFSPGDSIVVGKEKAVIESVDGLAFSLVAVLSSVPAIGANVRHYNADYSKYRDPTNAFVFVDDIKTGGGTGNILGFNLVIVDYDGLMADPVAQNRVSIFDDADDTQPLFAGTITGFKQDLLLRRISN